MICPLRDRNLRQTCGVNLLSKKFPGISKVMYGTKLRGKVSAGKGASKRSHKQNDQSNVVLVPHKTQLFFQTKNSRVRDVHSDSCQAEVPQDVESTHRSKNARRYSKHRTGTTWISIFLVTLLSSTPGNISFAVRGSMIVPFSSTLPLTDERPLGKGTVAF